MSKQTINIGASPNDGTGTPLRTSFDYTNQNFTELYTALGGGVGLPGATTQVIFNDGGTNLAGDAGLVYNKTTDTLTAGNATITGDLTVDTSTLKVDSANNRVGIGTATPACKLEVVAPAGDNIVSTFRSGDATAANNAGGGFQSISSATAASRVARVWLDADGADLSGGDYFFIQKNGNSGTVEFNQSSNAAMTFLTNGTERYRIASDGVATWSNVGGVAGTAMTLNSTGLGVGVSPSYNIHTRGATDGRIQVEGANGFGMVFIQASSGNSAQLQLNSNGGSGRRYVVASSSSGQFIIGDETAVVTRLTIDSSGNVGIGKTPAARLDVASARAASVVGGIVGTTGTGVVADECQFLIKNVNTAAGQNNGAGIGGLLEASASNKSSLMFYVDNGTAVTNCGRFDSNGNLILQSSATPATLTTNGQLTVNATSNTNLRFSYRGSDGTTRVANITLA